MEGPSLYLAAQQLASFKRRTVTAASGNAKTDMERFRGARMKDIFSWGKHLVFQFDGFALRVHFLMFGSFDATIRGKAISDVLKRRQREPRLAFQFKIGHMEMYSCAVRIVESGQAKRAYDFGIDLMSKAWDPARALRGMKHCADAEVGDVLLNQTIFAGLGNIIKNEILFLAKTKPTTPIRELSLSKRKELIRLARNYSQQFYEWRKEFKLRKNLKVHRKRICPMCGRPLVRAKTGKLDRWSYYCLTDQPF